jgi:hypothetical protein
MCKGLDDWFETIRDAAQVLRRASGCERLVLLGQGLGGTLALKLAEELAPVAASVLMAPVGNGKRYLRELSAWTRIVSDRIGIGSDPDDDTRCAVAGLRIAPGRLPAIATLGTGALRQAPSEQVLLLSRPGHGGDAALAEALASLGAAVTQRDYDGYETLTTDPTAARPPRATIAGIVDWIAERAAAEGPALASVATTQLPGPAEGLLGGRLHRTADPLRPGWPAFWRALRAARAGGARADRLRQCRPRLPYRLGPGQRQPGARLRPARHRLLALRRQQRRRQRYRRRRAGGDPLFAGADRRCPACHRRDAGAWLRRAGPDRALQRRLCRLPRRGDRRAHPPPRDRQQ